MAISANWTRENMAWAAGLFEGEGCIHVGSRVKGVMILTLTTTDRDVLERFHWIIGLGAIRLQKVRAGCKQAYVWWISRGEHCQAALAAMWPFLGARRRARAEDAIACFTTYKKRRWCKRGHKLETGAYGCKQCAHIRYVTNKGKAGVYIHAS